MAFFGSCSACFFVRSQLGADAACFLHAAARRAALEDVPRPLPTVDDPGPFTVHELARLLILRSRVRERS